VEPVLHPQLQLLELNDLQRVGPTPPQLPPKLLVEPLVDFEQSKRSRTHETYSSRSNEVRSEDPLPWGIATALLASDHPMRSDITRRRKLGTPEGPGPHAKSEKAGPQIQDAQAKPFVAVDQWRK
jgi:hypothetical protein